MCFFFWSLSLTYVTRLDWTSYHYCLPMVSNGMGLEGTCMAEWLRSYLHITSLITHLTWVSSTSFSYGIGLGWIISYGVGLCRIISYGVRLGWIISYGVGLGWIISYGVGLGWIISYGVGLGWIISYGDGLDWIISYEDGFDWIIDTYIEEHYFKKSCFITFLIVRNGLSPLQCGFFFGHCH
jgi:hypothetical protein